MCSKIVQVPYHCKSTSRTIRRRESQVETKTQLRHKTKPIWCTSFNRNYAPKRKNWDNSGIERSSIHKCPQSVERALITCTTISGFTLTTWSILAKTFHFKAPLTSSQIVRATEWERPTTNFQLRKANHFIKLCTRTQATKTQDTTSDKIHLAH